jgi:hypothetical protein
VIPDVEPQAPTASQQAASQQGCAGGALMARIVAFAVAIEVRNSGRIKSRRARCRSSVVEHPLGKGEVVSSILPGSTILLMSALFRSISVVTSRPDFRCNLGSSASRPVADVPSSLRLSP